jgi:hypothetical protein
MDCHGLVVESLVDDQGTERPGALALTGAGIVGTKQVSWRGQLAKDLAVAHI